MLMIRQRTFFFDVALQGIMSKYSFTRLTYVPVYTYGVSVVHVSCAGPITGSMLEDVPLLTY